MRVTNLAFIVVLVFVMPAVASSEAHAVPDLVCRGEDVVFIDHSRLKTSKHPSTDLYRFTGGKLYISSQDREEYFYNDIREVEPGRYVSAHKTIHFGAVGDEQFHSATAVHTNSTETTVLRLRCTRARAKVQRGEAVR